MKTGDAKDVEVTFPEEYHAAELAGKKSTFKVTIKEVKGKELPELDDDFAKEVDAEVEGIDALRTKLKEAAAEEKKQTSAQTLRDELVEAAAANATVDIPEAMIAAEVDRMLKEFEQRLQQQGMTLELYFQFSGQDEEALRTQMNEDAQTRVKVSLTLEAIAEKEEITVTEEDLNAEVEKMAAQFNMAAEDIKKALGGTSVLENDLRFQKTVEFLVDNAKIS